MVLTVCSLHFCTGSFIFLTGKTLLEVTMELTGEQLKMAETQLKRYLPRSQQVYGYLVLRNRVRSDPVRVFVDRWPEFNVIVCKPQYEQKGDLFKDIPVFAIDEAILEDIIRKSNVLDWTQLICIGINLHHMEIFKAVASEKGVSSSQLAVCHMMILKDVSNLPPIDRDFTKLSGCVLDAEGKPVSWILTYASCAMGILYTLPEHRGKGYAKVLISTMAKRLHAQGYPVYCFIEEENETSYKLFKNLGFTQEPSHREAWFGFND